MSGIMPWNGNDSSGNSEHGTANELMNAAKKTSIVSTAKPINGFEKRTKAQNQQYAKELKERRQQTILFAQYVKMNLLWQKEDLKCTKVLTKWRVGTFKNLTSAALIVARGVSQQQVIAARGEQQYQQIQQSTQQKISELQSQASQRANDRLRR